MGRAPITFAVLVTLFLASFLGPVVGFSGSTRVPTVTNYAAAITPSSQVTRDGWNILWSISQDDGIVLSNVTFNGLPVLSDARLPGILVTYIDSPCFFYDELLSGYTSLGQIFIENLTQGGFQIRAVYNVPGYDYQQVWQFRPDGTFLGLLRIGGGGCYASHFYNPRWRYDFQGNDTVSVFDGSTWTSVNQEVALNDTSERDPARDNTIFQVSGAGITYYAAPFDFPEPADRPMQALAVVNRPGEIETSHYPGQVTPYTYLNGENLSGQDAALWYLSDHLYNVTQPFQQPVLTGLIFYPATDFSPGFRISASSFSVSLTAGWSFSTQLAVRSIAGFTGNVSLSANVGPPGPVVTLGYSSVLLSAGGTVYVPLSISTTNSTSPGIYTLQVTGFSQAITAYLFFGVKVLQAPGPPPPPPPPPPSQYTRQYITAKFVGGGTPMGWYSDDFSWLLPLNFAFPFYGRTFSSLWVSSNGLISFNGGDPAYINSIPGLTARFAIAPLWDDLLTNAGPGYDIYVSYPDSAHVAIRWQASTFSYGYTVNFEAVLGSDGTIQFNYGSATGPVSATVGISNGAGDVIAQDITDSNMISSILFTPGIGKSPPVAVLRPDGQMKINLGQSIVFDGGQSYDTNNPPQSLTRFVFTLNGTIVQDGASPLFTLNTPPVGTIRVCLQVYNESGVASSSIPCAEVHVNAVRVAVVFVNPASVGPVPVGGTFEIFVRVVDVDRLAAHSGDLHYNTLVLTATAVDDLAPGTICDPSVASCDHETPTINDGTGDVTWSTFLTGYSSGFSGNGSLVKITFTVDAKGTSALSLTTSLIDISFNDIPHNNVPGNFFVNPPKSGPVAQLLPSLPQNIIVNQKLIFNGTTSFDTNSPPQQIIAYFFTIDGILAQCCTQTTYSFITGTHGQYTVCLTVVNLSGLSSRPDCTTVTVNMIKRSPTAIISGPAKVTAGDRVTYNGSSSFDNSTPPQPIVTYIWRNPQTSEFLGGDATLEIVFGDPGTFILGLTVCNSSGLCDTASIQVTVNPRPLAADLVLPKAAFVTEPSSFTVSVGGGTLPIGCFIDFGDMFSQFISPCSNGQQAMHTYSAAGSFIVTLRAVDSAGQDTGPISKTLSVQPEPQFTQGKLSWKHHLTTSAQTFTAKVTNPSTFNLTLKVIVIITLPDGTVSHAVGTFTLGPGMSNSDLVFTYNTSLLGKYCFTATLQYQVDADNDGIIDLIGTGPNLKSGCFNRA